MSSRPRATLRYLARRIRVLVVDDSSINREALAEMLGSRSTIEVIGTARNGEDALKKAIQLKPDLITLDLEMPVMDGFTFLRILMQSNPVPVIVVSARDEDRSVFRALELGAVDFIRKPGSKAVKSIQSIEDELIFKIENIAEVRIANIRFPGAELRAQPRPQQPAAIPPLPKPAAPAPAPVPLSGAPADLVLIGSSTGGPSAIQHLIQNWPPEITAPVVIAQHMPPGFTRHFAERLGRLTGKDVSEATDGETLRENMFRVAPGGSDVEISYPAAGRYRTMVLPPETTTGFVPNVDRLFESAALATSGRSLGVVLTGMGNDGARGAELLRKQGGRIIAESEATAIVYGMPREVVQRKAADGVFPLDQIPQAIRDLADVRKAKK